jgi:hypothetical protein
MSIGKKVEHYLPTKLVATCGWSFWYIHVLGLPTKMDNKSNDGAHLRHVKLHFKRKALLCQIEIQYYTEETHSVPVEVLKKSSPNVLQFSVTD